MGKDLRLYSKIFSRLRVSRSWGTAPHKPILLLAVIELIGQGTLRQNQVYLSPELIAAFLKYWTRLGTESHRSDIALPFFHMQSEGFWHLKANPGFELVLSSRVRLKTIAALKDAVLYAFLDDELFNLLQDPTARTVLTTVLVTSWFSDRVVQIEGLLQINSFQDLQDRLQKEGGAVYRPEDLEDEAELVVRDAAFRRIVVSVYEHRCAFCGMQVFSSLNQSIVDGAHIMPFSKFRDDRINNGLSLCKNHHWAFDRGWFSINDDFRILVSNDLRERSPNAKPMEEFHGERLLVPIQEKYMPRPEALRWHRENVFNSLVPPPSP